MEKIWKVFCDATISGVIVAALLVCGRIVVASD